MFWHVETDIMAFFITVTMNLVLINQKNIDNLQGKVFFYLSRATLVIILIDILATFSMEYIEIWWIYQGIMIAYLITIPLLALGWLIYICVSLAPTVTKRTKKKICLCTVPYLAYSILCLTNPVSELFFALTDDIVYSRGPLLISVGVGLALCYSFAGALVVIANQKKISGNAEMTMYLSFFVITGLSIIVQFAMPGWIIINSAYTMVLIIGYFYIHNQKYMEAISKLHENQVEKNNKLQSELTFAKEHLKSVIDLFPGGVFNYTADEQEQFGFLSANMLKMLGYKETELRKRTNNRFSMLIYEEDRARVLEEISEQVSQSEFDECQYRIETSSGELRWFSDVGHLVKDEKGDKVFYVVITDITEQMERDRLEVALKIAEQANIAKTEFLSNMSHDMRTPLNGILGIADLAMDQLDNPQVMKDYMQNIQSAGNHLFGLINDVLDMSKIENNHIGLHLAPYSLNEFARTINTIIGQLCKAKNIEFVFLIEDDGDKKVLLDKLRFDQIFLNLLSNAVKFTPEGGKVELICQCISSGDNKIKRHFIVRDNGKGMSKEFIPHAFDSFVQEDSTDTIGTGLGLSIVKTLVEKMGGSISLSSSKGVGTTIEVELEAEIASDYAKTELKTVDQSVLKGKRILLCEDHPLNMKIAMKLLEKRDMIVETAENGQEALKLFRDSEIGHFDAILMDIRMPVMDGLMAAKHLRQVQREDAGTIPIIAMTANAYDTDRENSKEAGMNAHLAKPIDSKLLYQTLAHCIGLEK